MIKMKTSHMGIEVNSLNPSVFVKQKIRRIFILGEGSLSTSFRYKYVNLQLQQFCNRITIHHIQKRLSIL